MKSAVLFFLALILFVSCGDSDNNLETLPENIQNYITANYSGFTIDESEEETLCDGTLAYEVELEGSGEELELVFDTEGSLLYTETEIQSTELPAEITSSISAAYPNHALDDEADRLEHPDGKLEYEVEVKEGSTELDVILAADGTVICEQEDTE